MLCGFIDDIDRVFAFISNLVIVEANKIPYLIIEVRICASELYTSDAELDCFNPKLLF